MYCFYQSKMASKQPLTITTTAKAAKASDPYIFTGILFTLRLQYVMKKMETVELNQVVDILVDTLKFISMVIIGDFAKKTYGKLAIQELIKITDINISQFYPQLVTKVDFIHSMVLLDAPHEAYKDLINIGAEMYDSDYKVNFLKGLIPRLDTIVDNIYHNHICAHIELFILLVEISYGVGLKDKYRQKYFNTDAIELLTHIKDKGTIVYNIKRKLFTVKIGNKGYVTKDASTLSSTILTMI